MHPVSAMQSALRHGFCGPSSPYPFTYTYTFTTASSLSRDRVRPRDWPELALIQIAIGIGIVHFEPSRAAPLAMGRKMFDPDSDPDPDFDVYSQRQR